MKAVKINPKDNAAVAVCNITENEEIYIGEEKIVLKENIPSGHKFALCDIKKNDEIIKYGFPIGFAKRDILKGEHIHSDETGSLVKDLLSYEYEPFKLKPEKEEPAKFFGFKRADKKVGIRNEVWIIPTVGCVNSIAKAAEKSAQKYIKGSIDGIYAFNHQYGCSQLSNDLLMTMDLLCGLIRHPNAGAVLVIGLGCENGNIAELKKRLGDYDENRVKFLNCQDEEDELSAADKLLKSLCDFAAQAKREPCLTSDLIIGLKCGGSDGFSGITANPVLGHITDKITSQGGSAVLTEVPEMFGAEQILLKRCKNREIFDKTVCLVNDFKKYFMKYNEPVDENPSPGNKAGGITTLAEKSLGCVQKGGNAEIEDVLNYGEPVRKNGFSLLQAPGNDLVASCALAASGAQLILFTTGRGTPFGCPVPTLKISSNSPLFEKKKTWIDFDAGGVLNGEKFENCADLLFDLIIKTSSGEYFARSERLDKSNLALFKDGVTL